MIHLPTIKNICDEMYPICAVLFNVNLHARYCCGYCDPGVSKLQSTKICIGNQMIGNSQGVKTGELQLCM